ncbi:VOC family protein [Dyella sp. 20L07]|uniref:VOC family protein n=1 Tax=Dyella sp. 20L07 TaxID=3384240 RepID=UPI003D2DB5CD
MGVRGLDHVNLRAPAELTERLRRFYIDIIGLHEGQRPAFRSRGYWLYAGEQAVIHLSIAVDGDGEPEPTGWLSHCAFACEDLAGMLTRLNQAGVPYRRNELSDQLQLFLTDPSGMGVELNFRTVER